MEVIRHSLSCLPCSLRTSLASSTLSQGPFLPLPTPQEWHALWTCPHTTFLSRLGPPQSPAPKTPDHRRPWELEQESWVRPRPLSQQMSVLSPILWWQDGQHSRFSLRQPRLPLRFGCRPTAWRAVSGYAETRRVLWHPGHSLATFQTQPDSR